MVIPVKVDTLPRRGEPSEHALMGPTTGPARDHGVPIHQAVVEGDMQIGERAAPRCHHLSDPVEPVHCAASVFPRVAGMGDYGGRHYLVQDLPLSLVPECCYSTP